MSDVPSGARKGWLAPGAVFLAVLAAQLWLVAAIGTDIPFQDQWDVEGRRLYPAARDGSLSFGDLFQAHNEHRIAWTKGLDLVLFRLNGQWDPLVQLVAGAVLHALVAAMLVGLLGRGRPVRQVWFVAAGVALFCLPLAGWHSAVWGFQSQVYFAVLFAVASFTCLADPAVSARRRSLGWLAAAAGLLAMGPGGLMPVALLGLVGLRAVESRHLDREIWEQAWPALLLLVAAVLLRVHVPEHDTLRATAPGQYLVVALRMLAWPHVAQPIAAVAMVLPMTLAVAGRLLGRRKAAVGEDAALLLGGWGVLVALAAAWARGGSGEFLLGVPSRYVDFVVLLPLANAWFAVVLAGEAAEPGRVRARILAAAWGVFLIVGWAGLTAEVMRGIILPRARDPEAPVRLVRAFQATGDPAVFAGQPRLLVPHPDPESVRAVLNDPRMSGALPPSLQPERPMGPLSRAVRWLLGRGSTAAEETN